jgi:hypothetical protein
MNEENKINEIKTHTHDGINSQKLKTYNVIPSFKMTPTELTRYLSRPAIEGEEFNNYDGTNYRKYIYINSNWHYVSLTTV